MQRTGSGGVLDQAPGDVVIASLDADRGASATWGGSASRTAERIYRSGRQGAESQDEWSTRLAALALFYAVGFFITYGIALALWYNLKWALLTRLDFVSAILSIVIAFAVFAVARWNLVSDRILIYLALMWLTPATMGALLAEDWIWYFAHPQAASARGYIGISYACVVIVVFPLLVRASVRQILVAAFSAAILSASAVALFALYRGSQLSVGVMVGITLPLLICSAMSSLPALLMVRVRRKLDAARRLGSYRLDTRLGYGGMGEVWHARHDLLARPAAIKLIRREALGTFEGDSGSVSRTLQRFEREVQATASLKSPHTISVYDFGLTDDGAFYYVMELLEGLDAKSLVERFGSIPTERAVHLLKQICHSLDEAHSEHLIHRDIKPANIFVCRLGRDYDFVKVLDFGLVKDAPGKRRQQTDLTMEGVAAGTPAFMAPEVALGSPDVDGRSDIYSLGCVAYWMITGKHVFEGDNAMAVALKHLQEEPVDPRRRSELPIPDQFGLVVMQCLEKDPARRPQSASALLELLEGCELDAAWDRSRAQRWWETHRPQGVGQPE